MNKFKLNLKIVFLCCLTTQFFNCTSLYAKAQYAITKAHKTYVYADKEMTTPIGFITMGKKIKVGRKSRNRGRVLPTVISGKLGWVDIKDLHLEEDLLELKGAKYNRYKVVVDELEKEHFRSKRSHLIFDYGRFLAGSDWKSTSKTVNEGAAKTTFGATHDIRVAIPLSVGQYNIFRLGANATTIEEPNLKYKALFLAADFSRLLHETKNAYVEAMIGIKGSPYGKLTILGDSFSGYTAGAKVAMEFTGHISQNWSFKLSLGYTYFKLIDFDLQNGISLISASFDGTIHGPEALAGFIYRI